MKDYSLIDKLIYIYIYIYIHIYIYIYNYINKKQQNLDNFFNVFQNIRSIKTDVTFQFSKQEKHAL